MALILVRGKTVSFRGKLSVQCLRQFYASSIFLKDPKEGPANRLNALLQDIIKEEKKDIKEVTPPEQKIAFKKHKSKFTKPKDLGKQIVESAEDVSKIFPGKQEQTEAELLHRLLYKDKPLTESIIKAASKKSSLMDILSDISIEESPQKSLKPVKNIKDYEYTKANKVKDVLRMKQTSYRPRTAVVPMERINLFGQEPLGIFESNEYTASEELHMKTWESLQRRDVQLQITHPPSNIYEQMIIWTERGMLWKFPIDNEQGLDEEKKTDFTEHIFLENYLDWCPEQGPIRHFMELVCVGLSRNYWLTAKEKKDHILWYKEFFTSKKELLLEVGAGEIKQSAPEQAIAS